MQEVPASYKLTRIKTASLYKLLFWSLAFHSLAIFAFWSEQSSAPLIVGKEYTNNIFSVALSPYTSPANASPENTSPVNTAPVTVTEKPTLTKTSPIARHKDSNNQGTLASKSSTQKINPKKNTTNRQHVARIRPGTANKKKIREISTETAELLQTSLGEKLSEYFHYPRIARKKGWQGQVKLRLRIEGNGHLSNIQLHISSGYSTLDNAAMNSLQKAAYLPDAKSWLQGMHYDIVVPVEYHLIDS